MLNNRAHVNEGVSRAPDFTVTIACAVHNMVCWRSCNHSPSARGVKKIKQFGKLIKAVLVPL